MLASLAEGTHVGFDNLASASSTSTTGDALIEMPAAELTIHVSLLCSTEQQQLFTAGSQPHAAWISW
jgi:hypothetical protein